MKKKKKTPVPKNKQNKPTIYDELGIPPDLIVTGGSQLFEHRSLRAPRLLFVLWTEITLQDSHVVFSCHKHRIISLNLEKLPGIYSSVRSYMDIWGITKYLNRFALLFHPFYFFGRVSLVSNKQQAMLWKVTCHFLLQSSYLLWHLC